VRFFELSSHSRSPAIEATLKGGAASVPASSPVEDVASLPFAPSTGEVDELSLLDPIPASLVGVEVVALGIASSPTHAATTAIVSEEK
jgi:hypothetical protein